MHDRPVEYFYLGNQSSDTNDCFKLARKGKKESGFFFPNKLLSVNAKVAL